MQEKNYSIKKWAKEDQPREKVLSKSPKALTDSELLAILIQNGNREKSAVEVARDVLRLGNNNLQELGNLSIKELMKIKGIGSAKAITIACALELCCRHQAGQVLKKSIVQSSKDIVNYLRNSLKHIHYEVFAVVFVNQANRVNHFEIMSMGGITCTIVDTRIILKRALEVEAVGLILCHNHPSGSLKPSKADIALTRKIREAANYMDISLFDHIIVSEGSHFSFADEGLIF